MGTLSRRDFYDAKYFQSQEIQRTSKLYTLQSIPVGGNLKVLDVGCGSGLNSQVIVEMGHKVIGVDISRQAIEKYRRLGFQGAVADLEKALIFNDCSFDLVFCSEVIEHLTFPDHLLKEICRVLSPGGRLVLSTPNSAFWVYRVGALFGYTVTELQHQMHLRFFSRRSLNKILSKAGFTISEEFGRNMYAILPDPRSRLIKKMLCRLKFREEMRFRTRTPFLHLSNRSSLFNPLLADTLITVATKTQASNS